MLFQGSARDFQELLNKEIDKTELTVEFLETIRLYNARIRASDIASPDFDLSVGEAVDNCIVRADDFGSVVSHVISNFAMIVSQTYEIRTLFIQNPPKRVISSLESFYPDIIEWKKSEYAKVSKDDFKNIYTEMNSNVLGQIKSKEEIISSLYKLSTMKSDRPIVLLLYGPSGVGKTETAKSLSGALGGRLTRVQISMMQTNEAFEYIFGAEHSKGSFARDLLSRESNVVLLDEFDKVNPGLYNAFYELFDEGRLEDTNYSVDIKDGIFICTTNFESEDEIRQILGPAMYSRIGACVEYFELSEEEKIVLVNRHFKKVIDCLDGADSDLIEESNMRQWFIENSARYNNIRIMKTKIERAIFRKLSARVICAHE